MVDASTVEPPREVISSVFPSFDERKAGVPFHELSIDSFDLMTLRVTLEQRMGRGIPDASWVTFTCLRDIISFYEMPAASTGPDARPLAANLDRQTLINMPQMAVGGLSESWLFRELGDMHWASICGALDTSSHSIADGLGNRLYATFVRIRWEGTKHLKAFIENELLKVRCELSRFGAAMFFSDCAASGADKTIRATLMSTFALRRSDNQSLLKGEPSIPEHSTVTLLPTLPTFTEEYRELRSGRARQHQLAGERFELGGEPLFELPYQLNPYQDFNGVNLLYFAAYPAIADICERTFVHANREKYEVKSDWALESSTIARDVFYYANCNIDDSILFRIDSFQFEPGKHAAIAASMYRKSDRQLLCNVFTVKAYHG